ncbi:M949_RS01915 family surface polysaccharide biosynthesis protein [Flavobacterium hauense]
MPNNKYILILLLLLPFLCFSQIKTVKLKTNDIPKTISYKGTVVAAIRYNDKVGDNILLATESGTIDDIKTTDTSPTDSASITAYLYTFKEGNWALNWKIYDFVEECPVDIELNFITPAISVTDLNKDGKAEVWVMHKVGCHGDVSPVSMKLIMYENGKKYAMRGENRAHVGYNEYLGGEYTFDTVFRQGPKQFRDYATQLWKKHILGK